MAVLSGEWEPASDCWWDLNQCAQNV